MNKKKIFLALASMLLVGAVPVVTSSCDSGVQEVAKASYKVQHMKQNTTGSGYTLADTETFDGDINSLTTAAAKTYDGFVAKPFTQAVITQDGNTVVTIKYDRIMCLVTVDPNGGDPIEPFNVRYGIKVSEIGSDGLTRTGYKFVKWVKTDGSDFASGDVVTSDMTIKAVWDRLVSTVTVSGMGINQTLTATYGEGLSDDIQKPEIHGKSKINGNYISVDNYDWTKVVSDTTVTYELDQANGEYDFDSKIVKLGDWGNLLYKDIDGVYTIEARVEGDNQGQLNGGFQIVDNNGMILNLASCMNTNGVGWVTAVLGDGTNRQVNLFTPENVLGQSATLPSIPVEFGVDGQFVVGNYIGIKMSLTYDADNSKLSYSLINEKTKTTTKVIDWTIDELKTNLQLDSFDLSKGIVGFYHRNQDCDFYAGNIKFSNDTIICRHEGGHYEENPYSCTTPGNKEFYECEKCGEIFMGEPDIGTFVTKGIKDYEGLNEDHPAYIAPRHEHGKSGTTIDADGMFNFECTVCSQHVKTASYECSKDVVEDIKLDSTIRENVKWLSFDVTNPVTPYAEAKKDQYDCIWSIGVMQKLSWESFDNANGFPFSICQFNNGNYLAQFTDANSFESGTTDFGRGFKWLNEINVTTDASSFSSGKITMGIAYNDGGSAVTMLKDLGGNFFSLGDFTSLWGDSYPCYGIVGIRANRDVTISNVVVSDHELEHLCKTPVVGNNTGLLGNECALCGTEFDKYTIGKSGDDYIDIQNWWDTNTVKYISFHVDKPEELPEYNCQGVGIVDDIEGWAEKSQFRLGISYYRDGRTWYLTYGNFQTFTSFEEAGICANGIDAFPEDGVDLAYALSENPTGKLDLTMYYKGGEITTWTKWRSINGDLEGGSFSNFIERIYGRMPMTISNVYCSSTVPEM